MPPGAVALLGKLVLGEWSYEFTTQDLETAGALLQTEGGQSLTESRVVLSAAVRRFAVLSWRGRPPYRSFADFALAYGGGPGRPGTRRARLYAVPFKERPVNLQSVAQGTLAGELELLAFPATDWAAVSMFPPLTRDMAPQDFRKRVESAVRARNAQYRYVDAPGTSPPRSNVFVSVRASRALVSDAVVCLRYR